MYHTRKVGLHLVVTPNSIFTFHGESLSTDVNRLDSLEDNCIALHMPTSDAINLSYHPKMVNIRNVWEFRITPFLPTNIYRNESSFNRFEITQLSFYQLSNTSDAQINAYSG